jgi:hypothetical protein
MKSTCEIYYIHAANRIDGSTIVVDEISKTFMATGSFGTFANYWINIGPCTLKEFLADMDFQYFMEKTRGHEWRQFDFGKTIHNLRLLICDRRRHESITKTVARNAWDELSEFDLSGEDVLGNRIVDSHFLMSVLDNDLSGGIFLTSPTADCIGFWENIWPLFLAEIRQEAEWDAIEAARCLNPDAAMALADAGD